MLSDGRVPRNLLHFVVELPLGVPEAVLGLHAEPQTRAVATEATQANGHLRRDRRTLGQDRVQHLARHPELSRRLAHGEAERREDALTQDRSRVRRLHSRGLCGWYLGHRRLPASVALLQAHPDVIALGRWSGSSTAAGLLLLRSCSASRRGEALPDDPRVAGGDAQQGYGRTLRAAPVLLPVAQGVDADAEGLGELRLRETDEAAKRRHVLPRLELSAHEALAHARLDASGDHGIALAKERDGEWLRGLSPWRSCAFDGGDSALWWAGRAAAKAQSCVIRALTPPIAWQRARNQLPMAARPL
jgi:hypothetical protein